MKTEVKKVNSNTSELIVTIELENAKKDYQKVFNKVKTRLEIPGFRKGKVPTAYIEKHYEQYIKEDYFESYAQNYYKEAIEIAKVNPIAAAEIKEVKWNTGEDAVFTYQFQHFPDDFEPIYKDLEVAYKEPVYDYDNQINESLKQIQDSFSEYIPFDESMTIQNDDKVTLENKSDEPIPTKAKNENLNDIIIGKNILGDDFNEKAIGKKINDTFEATVENNVENTDETEVYTFNFFVTDAFRKQLPEINDDLAKANDYESLDDMKTKIRESFEQEHKRVIENELNRAIVEAVAKANPMELPDEYFINSARYMFEKTYQANTEGIDNETLLKFGKMFTESQTIFDLVMEKVKKNENIQISDEDKDEYIKELVKDQNQTVEEYKENFKTFIEGDNFIDQVLHKKVVDLVKSTMKIVEPKENSETVEEETKETE
ncbi:MAG: trigger factor [Candidatus Cloacimonadales bacterium]|jgi:trigger factor|nr:trigger factor [Candidatus Cloacimonadota bacterium]MDD2649991.1 trigger factor [Candidatus Cloacimonadota bacterium]MDD3501496.1 trigger factor [Candidatus Cloacimonadota bacterium]MDX9977033.1 trigger factor [Candidatus Cloacimonadales bacterium]